jgi:hypothetical protein
MKHWRVIIVISLIVAPAFVFVMARRGDRLECNRKLVKIRSALEAYRAIHGNEYPSSMGALIVDGGATEEDVACDGVPFELVTMSRTVGSSANQIVVHQRIPNEPLSPVRVLRKNGVIEILTAEQARAELSPAIPGP